MKTSRLIATALVASALAGGVAARPASALFFNYTAGIQVQNLAASTASIVISFINPDGTQAGTTNDTIPANGSKTYFPLSGVSAGFNGSAVVSSDQQVAAVVNVLGNNGAAGASYIGFSAGANNLQVPLLMKDNYGYNTWFKVQNVGNAATNITVNYSDGGSASANNVQPNAAATFDQALETHGQTVFAATISASGGQPIAATVIEENPATMFAYNSFTGGSTGPVMPLINANNYGYITGVQIKNGSGSASTVTISYTPSFAGTACTETQTIPGNQSATFALGAFSTGLPPGATSTCALGATFVGSGRVTGNSANADLTVIVNQLNNSVGTGEAYGGFNLSSATSKVVMPLIMDRNYGFYTGFSVMNVGGAATDINCTFSNSAVTQSALAVPPGGALTAVQLNAIGNGYVGGATCTASGGGQIVGIVNELSDAPGDTFLVYEAINVP
jgi:hypothetical protein